MAIVLFRVFSSYVTDEYDHAPQAFWYMGIINFLLIFVCSALVGIVLGCLSALLLKVSESRRAQFASRVAVRTPVAHTPLPLLPV